MSELKSRDLDYRFSVYRTEAGAEVDFILEVGRRVFAIEVKASKNIGRTDLRGLRSFMEFHGRGVTPLFIYRGERRRSIEGVEIVPLGDLCTALELNS